MTISVENPLDVFRSAVSDEFMRDSIRCLKDCYKRAYEECRRYPAEVAHDLRPMLRRAEFEDQWRFVVERHGISCSFQPNAAKNCYHTLVLYGRVMLTASYVDHWVGTVRTAIFRNTYARANEGYLFPELVPLPPMPDAPLYALLVHDGAPGVLDRPCSAQVVFPDPDGKIVGRIDLVKRFPDLFVSDESSEEVVDDSLDIELRDDLEERKSV
jgi:hypothetical protein